MVIFNTKNNKCLECRATPGTKLISNTRDCPPLLTQACSSELPNTTPFPVPATNFLSGDVSVAHFPPFASSLASVCSAAKPPTLPSSSVLPSLWWALSHTHGSNIGTLDGFLMPEILRELCSCCVLDLKGILGALYIRGNPNIYSLAPTKEF